MFCRSLWSLLFHWKTHSFYPPVHSVVVLDKRREDDQELNDVFLPWRLTRQVQETKENKVLYRKYRYIRDKTHIHQFKCSILVDQESLDWRSNWRTQSKLRRLRIENAWKRRTSFGRNICTTCVFFLKSALPKTFLSWESSLSTTDRKDAWFTTLLHTCLSLCFWRRRTQNTAQRITATTKTMQETWRWWYSVDDRLSVVFVAWSSLVVWCPWSKECNAKRFSTHNKNSNCTQTTKGNKNDAAASFILFSKHRREDTRLSKCKHIHPKIQDHHHRPPPVSFNSFSCHQKRRHETARGSLTRTKYTQFKHTTTSTQDMKNTHKPRLWFNNLFACFSWFRLVFFLERHQQHNQFASFWLPNRFSLLIYMEIQYNILFPFDCCCCCSSCLCHSRRHSSQHCALLFSTDSSSWTVTVMTALLPFVYTLTMMKNKIQIRCRSWQEEFSWLFLRFIIASSFDWFDRSTLLTWLTPLLLTLLDASMFHLTSRFWV